MILANNLHFTYTLSVNEKKTQKNLTDFINKTMGGKDGGLKIPVTLDIKSTFNSEAIKDVQNKINTAYKNKLHIGVKLKINYDSITQTELNKIQTKLNSKVNSLFLNVDLQLSDHTIAKFATSLGIFKELNNELGEIQKKLGSFNKKITINIGNIGVGDSFKAVEGSMANIEKRTIAVNASLKEQLDIQTKTLSALKENLNAKKEEIDLAKKELEQRKEIKKVVDQTKTDHEEIKKRIDLLGDELNAKKKVVDIYNEQQEQNKKLREQEEKINQERIKAAEKIAEYQEQRNDSQKELENARIQKETHKQNMNNIQQEINALMKRRMLLEEAKKSSPILSSSKPKSTTASAPKAVAPTTSNSTPVTPEVVQIVQNTPAAIEAIKEVRNEENKSSQQQIENTKAEIKVEQDLTNAKKETAKQDETNNKKKEASAKKQSSSIKNEVKEVQEQNEVASMINLSKIELMGTTKEMTAYEREVTNELIKQRGVYEDMGKHKKKFEKMNEEEKEQLKEKIKLMEKELQTLLPAVGNNTDFQGTKSNTTALMKELGVKSRVDLEKLSEADAQRLLNSQRHTTEENVKYAYTRKLIKSIEKGQELFNNQLETSSDLIDNMNEKLDKHKDRMGQITQTQQENKVAKLKYKDAGTYLTEEMYGFSQEELEEAIEDYEKQLRYRHKASGEEREATSQTVLALEKQIEKSKEQLKTLDDEGQINVLQQKINALTKKVLEFKKVMNTLQQLNELWGIADKKAMELEEAQANSSKSSEKFASESVVELRKYCDLADKYIAGNELIHHSAQSMREEVGWLRRDMDKAAKDNSLEVWEKLADRMKKVQTELGFTNEEMEQFAEDEKRRSEEALQAEKAEKVAQEKAKAQMQEYNEYLQEKILFLEEEDELYKKCTKALNTYANAMRRKNSDFVAIATSMKKVVDLFEQGDDLGKDTIDDQPSSGTIKYRAIDKVDNSDMEERKNLQKQINTEANKEANIQEQITEEKQKQAEIAEQQLADAKAQTNEAKKAKKVAKESPTGLEAQKDLMSKELKKLRTELGVDGKSIKLSSTQKQMEKGEFTLFAKNIEQFGDALKEFGSKFGTFVGVEKGEGDSGRIRFSYGQTAQIEQQQVQIQKQVTKQKEKQVQVEKEQIKNALTMESIAKATWKAMQTSVNKGNKIMSADTLEALRQGIVTNKKSASDSNSNSWKQIAQSNINYMKAMGLSTEQYEKAIQQLYATIRREEDDSALEEHQQRLDLIRHNLEGLEDRYDTFADLAYTAYKRIGETFLGSGSVDGAETIGDTFDGLNNALNDCTANSKPALEQLQNMVKIMDEMSIPHEDIDKAMNSITVEYHEFGDEVVRFTTYLSALSGEFDELASKAGIDWKNTAMEYFKELYVNKGAVSSAIEKSDMDYTFAIEKGGQADPNQIYHYMDEAKWQEKNLKTHEQRCALIAEEWARKKVLAKLEEDRKKLSIDDKTSAELYHQIVNEGLTDEIRMTTALNKLQGDLSSSRADLISQQSDLNKLEAEKVKTQKQLMKSLENLRKIQEDGTETKKFDELLAKHVAKSGKTNPIDIENEMKTLRGIALMNIGYERNNMDLSDTSTELGRLHAAGIDVNKFLKELDAISEAEFKVRESLAGVNAIDSLQQKIESTKQQISLLENRMATITRIMKGDSEEKLVVEKQTTQELKEQTQEMVKQEEIEDDYKDNKAFNELENSFDSSKKTADEDLAAVDIAKLYNMQIKERVETEEDFMEAMLQSAKAMIRNIEHSKDFAKLGEQATEEWEEVKEVFDSIGTESSFNELNDAVKGIVDFAEDNTMMLAVTGELGKMSELVQNQQKALNGNLEEEVKATKEVVQQNINKVAKQIEAKQATQDQVKAVKEEVQAEKQVTKEKEKQAKVEKQTQESKKTTKKDLSSTLEYTSTNKDDYMLAVKELMKRMKTTSVFKKNKEDEAFINFFGGFEKEYSELRYSKYGVSDVQNLLDGMRTYAHNTLNMQNPTIDKLLSKYVGVYESGVKKEEPKEEPKMSAEERKALEQKIDEGIKNLLNREKIEEDKKVVVDFVEVNNESELEALKKQREEEEARIEAERKAEEERLEALKREAEEQKRIKEAEEARIKAEEEARKKEEARQKAEQERLRQQQEEEARQKAEQERLEAERKANEERLEAERKANEEREEALRLIDEEINAKLELKEEEEDAYHRAEESMKGSQEEIDSYDTLINKWEERKNAEAEVMELKDLGAEITEQEYNDAKNSIGLLQEELKNLKLLAKEKASQLEQEKVTEESLESQSDHIQRLEQEYDDILKTITNVEEKIEQITKELREAEEEAIATTKAIEETEKAKESTPPSGGDEGGNAPSSGDGGGNVPPLDFDEKLEREIIAKQKSLNLDIEKLTANKKINSETQAMIDDIETQIFLMNATVNSAEELESTYKEIEGLIDGINISMRSDAELDKEVAKLEKEETLLRKQLDTLREKMKLELTSYAQKNSATVDKDRVKILRQELEVLDATAMSAEECDTAMKRLKDTFSKIKMDNDMTKQWYAMEEAQKKEEVQSEKTTKAINELIARKEVAIKQYAQQVLNTKKMQTATEEERQAIINLVESMNLHGNTTKEVATKYQDLQTAIKQVKLDSMTRQLHEQKSLWDKLKDSIGGAIHQYMGMYLDLGDVIQEVTQIIRNAFSHMQDLDKSYVATATTMDLTQSEFNNWVTSSKAIADANGVTTDSLIEMVKIYAQAGDTVETVREKLEGTAMLQNVTEWDAEKTTSVLNSIINQYKLAYKEINGTFGDFTQMNQYVGDILVGISKNVSIDNVAAIQEMASAIDTAGAVINNAGGSLEWFSAVAATMAQNMNATGQETGNAFKMIQARILQNKAAYEEMGESTENFEMEVANAEKALNSVGVSIRGQGGDLRSLEEILYDLASVWGTLNDSTKQYVGYQVAGANRLNFLVTTMDSYQQVLDLQNIALNSQGALQEQSQLKAESLEGAMNRLTNATHAFYESILSSDGLKTLVNGLASAIDGSIKFMGVLGKLTPLITGLLAGFAAFNFTKITAWVVGLCDSLSLMGMFAKDGAVAMLSLKGAMSGLAAVGVWALTEIIQSVREVNSEFNSSAETAENLRNKLNDLNTIDGLIREYELLNQKLEDIEKNHGDTKGILDEIQRVKNEIIAADSSYQSILEGHTEEYREQVGLLESLQGLEKHQAVQGEIDSLIDGWFTTAYGVNRKYNNESGKLDTEVALIDKLGARYDDNLAQQEEINKALADENLTLEQKKKLKEDLVDLQERESNLESLIASALSENIQRLEDLEGFNEKLDNADLYNADKKGLEQVDISEETLALFEELREKYGFLFEGAVETLDEGGENLEQSGENFANDVNNATDDINDAADNLANSTVEMSNKGLVDALETMRDMKELLQSINTEGLTLDNMSSVMTMFEDFTGDITDMQQVTDYINQQIAGMEQQTSQAYYNMNKHNQDYWNNVMQNSADWAIYEQAIADQVMETYGLLYSGIMGMDLDKTNYAIDLRNIDYANATTMAEAESILNANLVNQLMSYWASEVNSKAEGRTTDMQNVIQFLNTQGVKEAQTVQELADLWAEFYNAKAKAIQQELTELSKIGAQIAGVTSGDSLEAYDAILDSPHLVHQLRKSTEALSSLNNLNAQFTNFFENVNAGFKGISGGLDQAKANIGKLSSPSSLGGGAGGGSGAGGRPSTGGSGGSRPSTGGTGGAGRYNDEAQKEAEKEVEDLELSLDRYYEYNDAIKDASRALDELRASGDYITSKSEMMKYHDTEITLINEKIKAYEALLWEQNRALSEERDLLTSYGFTIDDKGNITNYMELLKSMENYTNSLKGDEKEAQKEFVQSVVELVDEYTDLSNDAIPNTTMSIIELKNEITDSAKAYEEAMEYLNSLGDAFYSLNDAVEDAGNALEKYRATVNKDDIKTIEELNKYHGEEVFLINNKIKAYENLLKQQKASAEQIRQDLILQGFYSDAELGNIWNYDEKLRELQIYADTLTGEARDAQLEFIDSLIEMVDEYTELSNSSIPDTEMSIIELKNEIKDSNKELEEAREQVELTSYEFSILANALERVETELGIIESLQEHAVGSAYVELLNQEIALLEEKHKLIAAQSTEYQKQAIEMKEALMEEGGIEFDENGAITNAEVLRLNYVEKANSLTGEAKEEVVEEYEKLLEKMDEYNELVFQTIPGLTQEWYEHFAKVKELDRQKYEAITDIEKDITSAIEHELDKRREKMEESLDKQLEDLKEKMQKEKELYDKQYEEEDWNNQLSQEQRKLDEIKQQMVNLSRDTSLSGKSKLEQLKQEYQEQLDSMNTLIREHEKELADERYNEEIEALEKETEEKLKGIEETFSEENVAELVNQALVSGFVTLGDEVVELNGLMTTWLDETGDGLYAIGDYLKTDLIESLQTVRALMSDVGLTNATISPNLSSLPSSSINTGTLSGNNAVNINFGAPLLNIEGNVTEDVMSQVEAMVKQSQKNVVNEISKALNIK